MVSVPCRITPAGAGKTKPLPPVQCRQQDHPRRCGENSLLALCLSGGVGSPPQVRGKPEFVLGVGLIKRITPAGAGKTKLEGINSHKIYGSPPQVRGKLVVLPYRDRVNGITPAGAGKTRQHCAPDRRHGDHPRRCGENTVARRTKSRTIGSPPQVRGKPCLL